MSTSTSDPMLIKLSTSAYRALLCFYPIRFRKAYGFHMEQVFRDICLKHLRKNGTRGLLPLWIHTLFDLFKTIIEEHIERGTDMTQTKIIRLSGWGMALGAIGFTLGIFGSNAQSLILRTFGLRYSTTETIANTLLYSSILLLAFGMSGLYLRFKNRVGPTGKAALLGGGLFGLLNVLGAFMLMSAAFESIAWGVWFFSILLMFVSLAVFGVVALRSRVLPRWHILPLLAGAPLPITFTLVQIIELFTGGPWSVETADLMGLIALLISAASLVLLGYILQEELPAVQPMDSLQV